MNQLARWLLSAIAFGFATCGFAMDEPAPSAEAKTAADLKKIAPRHV